MAMPESTIGAIKMTDEEYTWLCAVGQAGKKKKRPAAYRTAPEVCQFYCGKVFKGRTVTRVTQGEDYRPRFHLSAADDTNGDSPLQGAPLVLTKSQFAELMRPSP